MTTIAAEMMLHCVYDGSKSMTDTDIERRPYHRNCSCSLHKSKGSFPTACFQHGEISFPKQKSWTDCSLSVTVSRVSSGRIKPGIIKWMTEIHDVSIERGRNIECSFSNGFGTCTQSSC